MSLSRQKTIFREDHHLRTLYFKVSSATIDKFDQKQGAHGYSWRSHLEKKLNYQSHAFTFIRTKNEKDAQPFFNVFVPIDANEFLKLGVKVDRERQSFFVVFLSITSYDPSQLPQALSETYMLEFVDVREYVEAEQHFHTLCEKLNNLEIQRQRRRIDVKREMEIWKTYLDALERVMKEKSILLPVHKLKKQSGRGKNRNKEWHFEYELNRSGYADTLRQPLLEQLAPWQVQHVQIDEDGGWIDLYGHSLPSSEEFSEVQSLLEAHCYRWQGSSGNGRRRMDFRYDFRLGSSAAQRRILEDIHDELTANGHAIECKDLTFSCFRWADDRAREQELLKHTTILRQDALRKVKVVLTHAFEDPEQQHRFCQQTRAGIRQHPKVLDSSLSRSSDLIITTSGLAEPVTDDVLDDFQLLSIECRLQPGSAFEEISLPNDAVLQDGLLILSGKRRSDILALIATIEKENPDFEAPSAANIETAWAYQLRYVSDRAQVQKEIENKIRRLKAGSVQWPEATLNLADEAAYERWLSKLARISPFLSAELKHIRSSVAFHVNDPQFRQTEIDRLLGRLRASLGENLADTDQEHHTLSGAARLGETQSPDDVLPLLEKIGGKHLKCHFPNPDGYIRLHIEWDEKAYREFLKARWSDIRNREIKFLTPEEKENYQREISGRGGSYRGGMTLGKLVQLRNGKAKILLEDKEMSTSAYQTGYLLPIFLGDLAQHKRLKQAMRAVRYPQSHFPHNRNLAHFIFDSTIARKVTVTDDIRSDRFWQLKHDLNEKALNEKQREAVWKALHAEDLVLIQGPPGTGKTTVIAEIIWQMLQEDPDAKILLSSQAHLAVDNALERLYKKNLIRPLRVASSAHARKAVEPEGRKYVEETIETWAKSSQGSTEEKDNAENAIHAWMQRISEKTRPTPGFEAVQERWRAMLAQPEPGVKTFMKDIYLDAVNIVAATCLECGRSDFLKRFSNGFDCVIIDEASKATPPELLVPLVLGRKAVIIGDHKQLPPMIEEKRIAEVLREMGQDDLADELDEIKVSQFEKLFLDADASIRVTLRTQYRMHADIMRVINAFYAEEGGLDCGIESTMDASDLAEKGSRWHGIDAPPVVDPDTHVIWLEVDTPETFHQPSYSNQGEVDAIRKLLDLLDRNPGFSAMQEFQTRKEDQQVGIISFYGKQVEKLRTLVHEFRDRIPIRLRTVDKFQGMERNIMIVSTVRSSMQVLAGKPDNQVPKKNHRIGFASDPRRVNVAFSRARRLLIIVGNEAHFTRANAVYKDIKKVIGRYGNRIDASQL